MKPTKAIFRINPGGSHCQINFDNGRKAYLTAEVYRQLERGFGIFLGDEFEDDVPEILVPSDEKLNRAAVTLRGFSLDPEIVEIATRYRDALRAGVVEHGDVLYEQA